MTKSVNQQNNNHRYISAENHANRNEKRYKLTGNALSSYIYNGCNSYKACDILDIKWNKWNVADEISYRAYNGNIYLILHENLLSDICSYLKEHNQHGSLPYLHIEGRDHMECYENPKNEQILAYLNENLKFYDIFRPNGCIERKKEQISKNDYLIQEFIKYKTVTDMKNIELELDSEKNIFIVGKRIILTKKHFPIKVKTEEIDGKKVKRVISLRDKNGCIKMMIS